MRRTGAVFIVVGRSISMVFEVCAWWKFEILLGEPRQILQFKVYIYSYWINEIANHCSISLEIFLFLVTFRFIPVGFLLNYS